ncbi:MAG: D-xylose transport system substrate-binding protein [Solirubrobacteraceae bacterium]|nr:D-xylose transport system substrate-binding protein [Solirubrobacteraceae bacterium]
MRFTVKTMGGVGAAALAAAAIGACGGSSSNSGSSGGGGSSGGSGGASGKVAFLMPDQASTRYEKQDHPLFEQRLKQLCAGCQVIYQNADADPSKQQQQATTAMTQGVKVMVVDPVDAASLASTLNQAKSRGIKVVAYDRPFPKFKVDFYVSFDNEKIGKLISTSLVDHLKSTGAASKGGILQVNGSPTDAAAGLIKKGVHEGVDPSGIKELAEFDTPDWVPAKAQDWVSGQISKYKGQIVGVVAANDGTGGGAISAFKAAGVNPVPPVTGNDAELAAIQRIVNGDQYNTIDKPIKIVASAAAEAAYALLQGKTPKSTATVFNTPAALYTPFVVTKQNVKQRMIDSGLIKASDLCTKAYAKGCTALGIK